MSAPDTFVLPALGEGVASATVTRWFKQIGDTVVADEPIAEVATDKVDSEIVAPFAGVLTQILVSEDETADTGQALAIITPAGSTPAVTPAEPPASQPHAATSPSQAAPGSEAAPASEAAPSPVPPAAAPLAAPAPHAGDPAPVSPPAAQPAQLAQPFPSVQPGQPTQPHAAADTPDTDSGSQVVTLSPIRRVIAERMMHSLQSTAQLTTVVEIDVTRIAHHRAALKAAGAQPPSFLSFFALAAIQGISSHPSINSTIDPSGTELTLHGAVDLGIAVDSPRGLMVPVIRGAGTLDAQQIGAAIADVATRVREGGISPSELSGGTFTITNTGSRGALFDTPILNSPQSAILGTGTITRRVVPVGEEFHISVRSFAYFSLTYDHRVIDGADAARYLSEVKRLIESGQILNAEHGSAE